MRRTLWLTRLMPLVARDPHHADIATAAIALPRRRGISEEEIQQNCYRAEITLHPRLLASPLALFGGGA